MRWREVALPMVVMLLVPVVLLAAQPEGITRAVFENGDCVSGTLESVSGGQVRLRTAYAGTVQLAVEQMVRLEITQPVYVSLASGGDPIVASRVLLSDSKATLVLPDGSQRTLALDEIAAISVEPPAPPAPPEPPPAPSAGTDPEEKWAGNVVLGIGALAGNVNQVNWRAGGQATRQSGRNQYALSASWQRSDSEGVGSNTRVFGRGDYRRLGSDRLYYNAFMSGEYDSAEQLEYRLEAGAALGYRLTASRWNRLGVELGLARTGERFRGTPGLGKWNLTTALDGDRKFGSRTQLSGRVTHFANLADLSDYRITADITVLRTLVKPYSLTVTLLDQYTHKPQAGIRPNDLRLDIGLGYTF